MTMFLDQLMWHDGLKSTVEVIRRGTFEQGTVMVNYKGKVIQTNIADLRDYDSTLAREYAAEVGE